MNRHSPTLFMHLEDTVGKRKIAPVPNCRKAGFSTVPFEFTCLLCSSFVPLIAEIRSCCLAAIVVRAKIRSSCLAAIE